MMNIITMIMKSIMMRILMMIDYIIWIDYIISLKCISTIKPGPFQYVFPLAIQRILSSD